MKAIIRQQTDWNLCCYSDPQSIVSDAQAAQKKNGNEVGDKSEPYLRTQ
ncbi:hypothetical protein [Parabacteroides merdae]